MRTLLLLLLLSATALADDTRPPLAKFADLEKLVQQVEKDGFKRFAFDPVRPNIPDEKLVFEPLGNTVDKEKAFRLAWYEAYDPIFKDTLQRGRAAANDKKNKDPLNLLN